MKFGSKDETFLSEREVAERWGMKTATVRNWRYRGKGPPHTQLGHRAIYREADVKAWEDKLINKFE